MTDDAARWMVERPEDRVVGILGDVQKGGEFANRLGVNDLGINPVQLVDLGAPVHRAQRGVAVGEREVAALGRTSR